MASKNGLLNTIEHFFEGHKDDITGLLNGVKSFDASQIQTILSALSNSTDKQVTAAKEDLQTVKDNGVDFATKLKGYAAQLPQLVKTLLPTLQGLLAKK